MVEPLRAGAVQAYDDGFRYFCTEACRARFRHGERGFDAPIVTPRRLSREIALEAAARAEAMSSPGRRVPELAPELSQLLRLPLPARGESRPLPRGDLGLTLAAVAALLGIFGSHPWLAVPSALCSVGAAFAALWRSFPVRREIGYFAWALGPSGVALTAVAALVAVLADPHLWLALVGAAVAAAATVLRVWLDAQARKPVEDLVLELLAGLPSRVRVPQDGEAMAVRYVEMDAAKVRTGEDVLALEGEAVAVDGRVKAGEAWALLFPGARTPVRRGPGDPLLAGARIVEGAVRIQATRTGADRALVRTARFGSGATRDAAPIARLADGLTRWGGLCAALFAASGLFLAQGEGIAVRLAAAAAVLLAAPLAGLRRAAESPLVVAAATAGARGMVFQSARALERAGRVARCALGAHGTFTEGQPEVVEVHSVDGGDTTSLLALVGAAEVACEEHPIARSIRAHTRTFARESVRRATFLPGRGVTAITAAGEALVAGNRQLLLDEGVSVAVADAEAARAEARGRTVVFVGLAGRVRALILLVDPVRPGARSAVQRLIDLDVEIVLLSGDHRGSVEALAKTVGVDHVKAELMPEERGAEVRRLREGGGGVAVIGRAPDDDAALAAADVPVALGAAGGPAGERGIALATDDVRDAADALWIAHAARSAAWRGAVLTTAAGLALVALAATSVIGPPFAALLALALDAYSLPAGARLLRRIALRLPARS